MSEKYLKKDGENCWWLVWIIEQFVITSRDKTWENYLMKIYIRSTGRLNFLAFWCQHLLWTHYHLQHPRYPTNHSQPRLKYCSLRNGSFSFLLCCCSYWQILPSYYLKSYFHLATPDNHQATWLHYTYFRL